MAREMGVEFPEDSFGHGLNEKDGQTFMKG